MHSSRLFLLNFHRNELKLDCNTGFKLRSIRTLYVVQALLVVVETRSTLILQCKTLTPRWALTVTRVGQYLCSPQPHVCLRLTLYNFFPYKYRESTRTGQNPAKADWYLMDGIKAFLTRQWSGILLHKCQSSIGSSALSKMPSESCKWCRTLTGPLAKTSM
jgi:hypothetical protein